MYHVLDVDWLKLSPITAWAWKYRQLRCGQDASRMQLYRMRPGCIPTKCTCHNTIICASRALRNLKIFASRHASWQLLMPPLIIVSRTLAWTPNGRWSTQAWKRACQVVWPCYFILSWKYKINSGAQLAQFVGISVKLRIFRALKTVIIRHLLSLENYI